MDTTPSAAGDATAQKAPKDATPATRELNEAAARQLPFADRDDFEDAKRGFIATLPALTVKDARGRVVWSLEDYKFLEKDEPPPTVHPSLWRMARLNMNHGLFKVADCIYQVRGFDLSNMTIVEGDKGLVVIDPLISAEVAKAGMDLYYRNRPHKPVVAVVYTHCHVDHFGGVKGVTSDDEVVSGQVKILAPEGFLEEAISENVFAGNAMARRSHYQYGVFLPRGPRGQVDAGLGKNASTGAITFIAPTDTIARSGETRTIAGMTMEFELAPNTEAPAEMMVCFPELRALDVAEEATHTLHNLYTLRGAQVRSAVDWWKALNRAIERYAGRTDVVLAQHHWPTWGQARVAAFLSSQRDVYKYIHDQSLRLANQGWVPTEIAEATKLPGALANQWANRDYYGSVDHNAKAVYQRYLGWYDSNPSHLYALPPEEEARRYVAFMGGAAAATAKARESFAKGDYRWVATVMDRVVFAEPDNRAARELAADALEQLGYQSENPTWRNEFLTGAHELRSGVSRETLTTASPDTLRAMPSEMLLDFMGIHVNGPKAAGKTARLQWKLPLGDTFAVELENGVLVYTADKQLSQPDATLTMPKEALGGILARATTLDAEVKVGRAVATGDVGKVRDLLGVLDEFQPMFDIVTP